jgi:hypothetical protein
MATPSNSEKVIVQIGEETIELKGADKEAFLAQRKEDQAESQILAKKESDRLALRQSALAKLGLTEEEINAIL